MKLELGNWLASYRHWRARRGSVGVSFTEEGIAIAHVRLEAEQPYLCHHGFYACVAEVTARAQVLAELVQGHQWVGMPAAYVLQPNDYQLVHMPKPKVPEAELSAALRWQLREYIDYSVEDAAFDYVTIPKGTGDEADLLLVSVLPQARLHACVAPLQQSGLHLARVDIMSLALAQTLQWLPSADAQDLALLYITSGCTLMAIFSNGHLCFVRRLDLSQGGGKGAGAVNIAQLQHEVSKTLDFCAVNMPNLDLKKLYMVPSEGASIAQEQAEIRVNGLRSELIDFEHIFKFTAQGGCNQFAKTAPVICGALHAR